MGNTWELVHPRAKPLDLSYTNFHWSLLEDGWGSIMWRGWACPAPTEEIPQPRNSVTGVWNWVRMHWSGKKMRDKGRAGTRAAKRWPKRKKKKFIICLEDISARIFSCFISKLSKHAMSYYYFPHSQTKKMQRILKDLVTETLILI